MSAAGEAAGTPQPVTLTLNGMQVEAQPGQTILEVARSVGVDIPTLCHDPRLEPYGACRMCLVEVEGARGPMAACGTAVKQGMVVHTHTEKIVKLRKFVLELLLTNHPLDCPVCEAAGDCRLQDYAYEYLVDMVPWGWRPPVVGEPGDHPNVAHYGARCILCGRCVRICREIMSIGCWGYLNRGYDSEVDTPYRLPLTEVGCVSCGQCVSTCPVGAITGQRSALGARAWQTTKTVSTCGYCADGCRLVLHSYRDKVVQVSADLEKGLNQGNLCVKGRFGLGYIDAEDRLTQPLLRDETGALAPASWEEAISVVAGRLRKMVAEAGGSAVAAVCGTHCTNEAAYLLQKLMRTLVGSNNITAEDAAEWSAYEALAKEGATAGGDGVTRKDVAEAQLLLLVGADLTESDPVLALEVIRALRKGRPVIVLDSLKTTLASKAPTHLAVRPGGEAAALRAMLRAIVDAGLQDKSFVETQTEGYEAFLASAKEVDAAAEAGAAGVDLESIREAATRFAQAASALIILGPGVLQGAEGVETAAAAVDLALLTGNAGRPGTGVYFAKSGANSCGLFDMGVRPDRLPTGSWSMPEAVEAAENAWGAALQALAPGVAPVDLLAAIEEGKIRALYVVGTDPALAWADEARTRVALERLELLVVQDAFPTTTAAMAHVVFPAAVTAEDEGTFTNAEGLVQRVRAAVNTPGAARQDWAIVNKLAAALGNDWAYSNPEDVLREIAEVVPAYAGLSYQALEVTGCTREATRAQARPRFYPLSKGRVAGPEVYPQTDEAYPLLLVSGPVLTHHGTGERSRRAPGLAKLLPEPVLEINASDVGALGLGGGDRVRVSARDGGTVEVTVKVSPRPPAGLVFLGRFSEKAPVSRLLKPGALGAAVRVEKV
jgi:formate dehydrogenase alpha subunit